MFHALYTNAPVFCTLIACALSYLICGIPFGLLIGKLSGRGDIRAAGSGNIGTTNALRVAGPKVALATLALDVAKGALCVSLGTSFIALQGFGLSASCLAPGTAHDWMVALLALSCLYGHVFSPYLKFHGGKGIATGVGILLGFFWPLGLLHLAIFLALVLIFRYVSLGSIVTAAVVPLTMYFFFPQMHLAALALWTLLAWTVVWAHRENIQRLSTHTESKLSFKKRADTIEKTG